MNEFLKPIKDQLAAVANYDINEHYLHNKFPKEAWDFVMKNIIAHLNIDGTESPNGLEVCQTFEALGYACSDGGLSFAIGAQTLAATIPFALYATDEQKEKYLAKMLNGELICANAITETEAGSDIFSMRSRAEKQAGNYLLNGTKTFCSNIREANMALVYLVSDQEKGAHGGITVFIVDAPNFKTGQTFSKMGLRTCSIGELILENTVVGKTSMLGEEGAGLGIFTTAMDWERIGLSAMYVGTMQRLFEQAVTYSKNRVQGGTPIGKHQAVSHKIAEMKTHIHACRLMVYDAAAKLGKERSVSELASMCKLFVSEHYINVCEQVMQIHGGNGYMEDYEIERCLRDAHASTIYSGTSEIQKNIIARWSGL
ncbi:MAG: acyl-CoA dehydrogenase family protein [Flavobacteriales bacterium]|nr:acyl-CoA dehydrogenase family protein [Flavobacteriales bacterium]